MTKPIEKSCLNCKFAEWRKYYVGLCKAPLPSLIKKRLVKRFDFKTLISIGKTDHETDCQTWQPDKKTEREEFLESSESNLSEGPK